MASNKVAFAVVALGCVAAAGAGGYLAQRQSTPAATMVATAAPAVVSPAVAPQPSVQETEPVAAPVAKAPKEPKRVVTEKLKAAPVQAAPKLKSPAPAFVAAPPPSPDLPAPPARPEPVERVAEVPAPPAPPQRTFDELVISTDSVIGLQSESKVTSETAHVEDRVEARVTRDVRVADRVAIPAGSRAIGFVTQVERGGKFKEQAKLSIRFQTIVLADGTRLPISTASIEREGDAKGNSSAAKVGGAAVAGTILGAILGGGKGAAIGAAAGAGGGAAAVQAGDRSIATLRSGESITIRLLSPVTVITESK